MRRASTVIVLGLVSGIMAPAGRAQSPSTTIHGRVLAADTGDPIRNARVGTGGEPDAPVALTDAEGRFALASVPAERHELSVAKTGYAAGSGGATDGVEIRLDKGAAITGRALDDTGDPIPLMLVVAERVVRAGTGVTFQRVASVATDDLGEYRLFGLAAGEYVVGAGGGRSFQGNGATPIIVSPGQPPHNYYPRAETPAQAQAIRIAAGEEKPGIDLTVALPPFAAQPPSGAPPMPRFGGSAVIRGRVIRADGRPIRRARVQLASGEDLFSPYAISTDDDGRYEFGNLRAGTYLVRANALGGNAATYGQRNPADRGELLTLKAGAQREHVDITLPRPGVIGGRLFDEYGDPIANASVRVERVVFSKGRRRAVGAGSSSSQTDDFGRYRLFGLPPGRYLVTATVGETDAGLQTADWPGYARTYFPGTPSLADAQAIDVAQSQEALTIDFSLVRGHVARISGTALTADGRPLQGQLTLMQSYRSRAVATAPVAVRTGEDGGFAFSRVAPGEYVLQAATSRSTVSTEGEFTSQYVTVNGVDIAGMVVRLSTGSTIEGRLTFDGGEPPADPDFHLSALPMDLDMAPVTDDAPARADIHDDWTFDMSGINGPRVLLLPQAPDGWMLKAVLINGVDMTDSPLVFGTADQSLRAVEVVLTTRVASLTVSAGNTADTGTDFRIIAFSTDRARRYAGSRFFAVGVSGRDGSATLHGMAPGDYYVAAAAKRVLDETTAADDMEFLESLVAGATKVTVTEGEAHSVSVSVIR